MTYGIREGLYSPDPDTLRPIPAGAIGHDLSDDKKVWTFHLRPEARWSNGDPVTAHDYVFSWRRMLEEPGEYTYLFYYIKNAEEYEKAYAKGEPIDFKTVGIEAVDDLTLRVTLDNPRPVPARADGVPALLPAERAVDGAVQGRRMPGGKYSYRADYTRPRTRSRRAGRRHQRAVRAEGLGLQAPADPGEVADRTGTRRTSSATASRWSSTRTRSASSSRTRPATVDWLSRRARRPRRRAAREGARPTCGRSPAFGTMFLTLLVPPEPARQRGRRQEPAGRRPRPPGAGDVDRQAVHRRQHHPHGRTARRAPTSRPTARCPTSAGCPARTTRRARPSSPTRRGDPQAAHRADLQRPRPRPALRRRARPSKLLAEAGYPDGKGFPPLPILYNSDNAIRAQDRPGAQEPVEGSARTSTSPSRASRGRSSRSASARRTTRSPPSPGTATTPTSPRSPTSTSRPACRTTPTGSTPPTTTCSTSRREGADAADARRDPLAGREHDRHRGADHPDVPLRERRASSRTTSTACDPNPRSMTIFKAAAVDGSGR